VTLVLAAADLIATASGRRNFSLHRSVTCGGRELAAGLGGRYGARALQAALPRFGELLLQCGVVQAREKDFAAEAEGRALPTLVGDVVDADRAAATA